MAQAGRRREYSLILPWGAPVEFKRLHLEHPAGVERLPALYERPPPPPRPKYVAYGDSGVVGWCAATSHTQCTPHNRAPALGAPPTPCTA